jgi:hypothetical protein
MQLVLNDTTGLAERKCTCDKCYSNTRACLFCACVLLLLLCVLSLFYMVVYWVR